MPTDTQRAPTREEQMVVGGGLHNLIEYGFPLTQVQADRLIIAIAKRVREAEEGNAADAMRWRGFAEAGFVYTDDDGGLGMATCLADEWEDADYLTARERQILRGDHPTASVVRGKALLDRIIDAAYEIDHAPKEPADA